MALIWLLSVVWCEVSTSLVEGSYLWTSKTVVLQSPVPLCLCLSPKWNYLLSPKSWFLLKILPMLCWNLTISDSNWCFLCSLEAHGTHSFSVAHFSLCSSLNLLHLQRIRKGEKGWSKWSAPSSRHSDNHQISVKFSSPATPMPDLGPQFSLVTDSLSSWQNLTILKQSDDFAILIKFTLT